MDVRHNGDISFEEDVTVTRNTFTIAVTAAPLLALPAWASAQGAKKMPKQTATITMEKGGTIKIEDAPKTVENFVTLAKKGFSGGVALTGEAGDRAEAVR